jgi:hypothetical protein
LKIEIADQAGSKDPAFFFLRAGAGGCIFKARKVKPAGVELSVRRVPQADELDPTSVQKIDALSQAGAKFDRYLPKRSG